MAADLLKPAAPAAITSRSSNPRIVEAYCASCGNFIAASPSPKLLNIVERMHVCPSGEADVDGAAEFGRCRITRYLRDSSSGHQAPAVLARDERVTGTGSREDESGLSK